MSHDLPAYITVSDAAELLGVTRERIMYWIREGFLKPVGQTEAGAFLLRRRAVLEDGEPLANLWPHRVKPKPRAGAPELSSVPPKLLTCGCCPSRAPLGLCRIGVSLLAALQLAEGFAVEFSTDPLYRRLLEITREALTKHLAGGDVISATMRRATNETSSPPSSENPKGWDETVSSIGSALHHAENPAHHDPANLSG